MPNVVSLTQTAAFKPARADHRTPVPATVLAAVILPFLVLIAAATPGQTDMTAAEIYATR